MNTLRNSKRLNIVLWVGLAFLFLSGCQNSIPTLLPVNEVQSSFSKLPTTTPVTIIPISDEPTDSWQEYTSQYESDAGTLHYTIRYPTDWIIYPGETKSAPGLESETWIQNFRCDIHNCMNQEVGAVRISIYALACTHFPETCTSEAPILAANLPGILTITEDGQNFTVWEVFLNNGTYRFNLTGFMKGSQEENEKLTQLLNKILSTLEIY